MISYRFNDPLEVSNDPKRSFEVIFLNLEIQFRIRAETAIMQQLNINLPYKILDPNWVFSSHLTRWRCRIISWRENHVIYFCVISMRNCRITDFRPFSIKNSLFWVTVTQSRDFVMVSWTFPTGHAGYIQYIIFCLIEWDYGSKKEILINPSRFRIFWAASPIFGTASTIE